MAKMTRSQMRVRRHKRLRGRISGTADRPRLCVFCSGKQVYAQVIDDENGHTLASASTLLKELRAKGVQGNVAGAAEVGRLIATRAQAANIETVVFDRGGFRFHGRVKAVADAAREGGLKF